MSSIKKSSIKKLSIKKSSIETRVSKCRVLKLEYRNVEYRKVEIRKSRINKVSDATYISDVVFFPRIQNIQTVPNLATCINSKFSYQLKPFLLASRSDALIIAPHRDPDPTYSSEACMYTPIYEG